MSKKTKRQKIESELLALFGSRDEIRSAVRHFESVTRDDNAIVRTDAHRRLEELYSEQSMVEGMIIELKKKQRRLDKTEARLNAILNILEKK